jgi:predicted membrane-bound spermidine synthase
VIAEAWSVIAIIMFWGWVASSLLFIFKAFPRLGVFQSRPALVWGAVSVLCATVWMIALRLT